MDIKIWNERDHGLSLTVQVGNKEGFQTIKRAWFDGQGDYRNGCPIHIFGGQWMVSDDGQAYRLESMDREDAQRIISLVIEEMKEKGIRAERVQ